GALGFAANSMCCPIFTRRAGSTQMPPQILTCRWCSACRAFLRGKRKAICTISSSGRCTSRRSMNMDAICCSANLHAREVESPGDCAEAKASAQGHRPNETLHLPGRLQGHSCVQNRNVGPVKCKGSFGLIRHLKCRQPLLFLRSK